LILCDWNMPTLTGGDLIADLQRTAPELLPPRGDHERRSARSPGRRARGGQARCSWRELRELLDAA
jgi:hypothetical protein